MTSGSLEHGHGPAEIAKRLSEQSRPDMTRDLIYGGIDGAITTFAIVAGVEGAGLAPGVVVAIGLASVFADGFSMAASNYSGSKAERDNIRRLRAVERRHIEIAPDGEREEVRQILRAKGLRGHTLEQGVEVLTRNRELWIETMLANEYGVAIVEPQPVRAGLATFVAFLICGSVPLVPYLAGLRDAFLPALVATLLVFLLIGALKARTSMQAWWASALETFAIGSAAAGVAYGIGVLVDRLIGV